MNDSVDVLLRGMAVFTPVNVLHSHRGLPRAGKEF